MSEDLCRAFMRDLEAHDLRGLERWFSETTTVCIPPSEPVRGPRRILALFRTIFRSYDEIHWRVTDVYAVPGRRCIYLSESWGARRGVAYRNHIVTLIDFDEDGRIAFLSDYFKDTVPFVREGARAAS